MNRLLVTVIDFTGSQSWCDAMQAARPGVSKLAGLQAPVAHDHDCGRESDDTNTSGEGPG
jgi:hypothetical protein